MLESNFWFLFLNSTVVWFVIAAVLMKSLRLKALTIVIIIAPFIIGSTFRKVAGVPELVGFYGTSILYGIIGLIGGIIYMEYEKAKRRFQKASKIGFLARGGITLSSFYLISYFVQKIIFGNPTVQFALNWIKGGQQAKDILNQLNHSGAMIAGGTIVLSFGVLGAQQYLQYQSSKQVINTAIAGAENEKL